MTPTLPIGIPDNWPVNQPYTGQRKAALQRLRDKINAELDKHENLTQQTRLELIKLIIEEHVEFWE